MKRTLMKYSLRASLAVVLFLAAGTTVAGNAIAQGLAGMATAVPPFTLSYKARPVPGSPGELRLLSLKLSGVNPASEAWVVGCQRCQGGGHLSSWRRVAASSWVSTVRGRTVMDSRTILFEAVTAAGRVGRFKVYSVRPPVSLLAIKTEGCISPAQQAVAPHFPAHISQIAQVPCSGLLLPAQGTAVQSSDAVTVTFRTPKHLPPGVSWVLAIQANGGQASCVKFDAAFLRDPGPIGTLLTATLRPTDSLAIPSPLPQWCTGKFSVAVFTSGAHGKTVHKVSQRIDDFTVS